MFDEGAITQFALLMVLYTITSSGFSLYAGNTHPNTPTSNNDHGPVPPALRTLEAWHTIRMRHPGPAPLNACQPPRVGMRPH